MSETKTILVAPCKDCGRIGRCYWNAPNRDWYCLEGCEAAKKRGTPDEVRPEDVEIDTCRVCDQELVDDAADDCIDACYPCALKEANERAEQAEAKVAALEAEVARLRPLTVRSVTCCETCAPTDKALREALAKVAALEARLAEVAPVVEAAQAYVAWSKPHRDRAFMAGGSSMIAGPIAHLVYAVQDHEHARAKREQGGAVHA